MMLLADACYGAFDFLDAVTDTGAAFLSRSTRKRRPTVRHPLPDGSCPTTLCAGKYQAGRGYGRLKARVRKRDSKYTFTAGKHPRASQAYTLHYEMIKKNGPDKTDMI